MAVAHVQTSKTIDNDGNTTATTSSMTFSSGGLALLGIVSVQSGGTPTISSVKLDGTTNFTVDKSLTQTAGSFTVIAAVASLPNVSGAHTVTVTFSAGQLAVDLFLTEVSGAATSSITDGTGASAVGVNNISVGTGTFTTTNSNDFWYCAMGDFDGSNPSNVTAGSGWTIPTNGSELNGSANQVGAVEYQANPGATSGNGQWTIANTEWVTVAMAYKVLSVAADTLWAQSSL